ncbi:MAG: BBE domain-containing protein [Thermoanaerobaculia bacterium]
MRQFSTGGNCVNFLTEDEGPERIAASLGPAVGRLTEVKKQWGPENRFRVNRNIRSD